MTDDKKNNVSRELKDSLKNLDEQMQSISLVVHESMEARHERREKRHFVVIILLIALLVATNGAWLAYEMSMETVTETTTITQENPAGNNNYNSIGGDGDITNGETNDNQN